MRRSFHKSLIFLVLSLGFIASFFFGAYIYLSIARIPSTQRHLLSIAMDRALQVDTYLMQTKEELLVLSAHKKVTDVMQNLIIDQALEILLDSFQKTHNFRDMLLIDPNGIVCFSSVHKKVFASMNLMDSKHLHRSISHCFQITRLSLTSNVSSFVKDDLLNEQTMYQMVPIFLDKKFIGILAAQIDQDQLFKITNNYFDLGKTGEVVLGQEVKGGAQIIAPTRFDPDITFNIIEQVEGDPVLPIQRSVRGERGFGVATDYRGSITISAWTYSVMSRWGIELKMDRNEALTPLYFLYYLSILVLTIFLMLLSAIIVMYRKRIREKLFFFKTMSYGTLILIILLLATAIAGSFVATNYYRLRSQTLAHACTVAQSKVKSAAEQINRQLVNVAQRVQSIADDLSHNRLKKEDLIIRTERDLNENPLLSSLMIILEPDSEHGANKIHGINVSKDGNTYKATEIEGSPEFTQLNVPSSWYKAALKQEAMWLNPVRDSKNNALLLQYVVPFYTKRGNVQLVAGVVTGVYNITNQSNAIAQKLFMGETGYGSIVSDKGLYVYHPIPALVMSKKSIFDIAQEQANKGLYTIYKKFNKQSGGDSYLDSGHKVWIFHEIIPQTHWTITLSFLESEILLNQKDAHSYFILFIVVLVSFLCMLAFLVCRLLSNILDRQLYYFSIVSSLILFSGLCGIWALVRSEKDYQIKSNETVISSETTLNAYLNEQKEVAKSKNEALIIIPTGIFLYALNFPDVNHFSFTGYVWETFRKNIPAVAKGFRFPEADRFNEKIEFYEKNDMQETTGWKIEATLKEAFNYSNYPFDKRRVSIPFTSKDMNKAITLVPDLLAYQKERANTWLGISHSFKLPGFDIDKTFFSFKKFHQETTLGLSSLEDAGSDIQLYFNILLSRDALNALIVYIIPLLVILFALYALFSKLIAMQIKDISLSQSIVPFTGLLFSIIILHGNLRNNYPYEGILYLEYLIFLSYLTILLLIIHGLLQNRRNMQRINLIIKILFWPVQLAFWFLISAFAFYH